MACKHIASKFIVLLVENDILIHSLIGSLKSVFSYKEISNDDKKPDDLISNQFNSTIPRTQSSLLK